MTNLLVGFGTGILAGLWLDGLIQMYKDFFGTKVDTTIDYSDYDYR